MTPRASLVRTWTRSAPALLFAIVALGCRKPEPEPVSDAGPAAPAGNASSEAYTFPVPKADVEAVLNPAHLPPYDGPTGSVEGTVYVTGPQAPDVRLDAHACPAAIDTYGKLFRSAPAADPEAPRALADAVVVVVGYSGAYVPERQEVVRVTIGTNCAYPTRSIAMTFGQRLEVINQSNVPFAPQIDKEFSPAVMMAPPKAAGEAIKIYPRRAEYSALSDRMAPFMHEDLYVLRQPLHAVTDLAGHYRIDGVPVGKLTVGVRHPGVRAETEAPVEVAANVVRKVDVTLHYIPPRPVVPGSIIP